MTDQRRNPSQQMQQTTINQAQTAFEQAFELQRNATKMALSMLEMQDTAGRQGLEMTKVLMQNYLQGVEAIMPEMDKAMEMAAPTQGADGMNAGGQQSGHQQWSKGMAIGQQMAGGQQPGQQMAGGQQPGQQMPSGQHDQQTQGESYGGESHGYDRSGQRGQPRQRRQSQHGGHGRTGEWIPYGRGPEPEHAGPPKNTPRREYQRGESQPRQMTTPTGGDEMESAPDRDQMEETRTERDDESESAGRETSDHQSSDSPEDE